MKISFIAAISILALQLEGCESEPLPPSPAYDTYQYTPPKCMENNSECSQTQECKQSGKCSSYNCKCWGVSNMWTGSCEKEFVCKMFGECTMVDGYGVCIASSWEDCKKASRQYYKWTPEGGCE